jgi:SAM-dependent methyltransferase
VPAAELGRFYAATYGPYAEPAGALAQRVSRVIRARQASAAARGGVLAPVATRPEGVALDVGCGRGDLAAALVARGWTAVGVEPSPSACAHARARGVEAREGTLLDVPLEPSRYDFVLFNHSLEHTDDPVRDLALVHDALRPGGVVSIAVPNFGGAQARRFGPEWYHLDVPRHRTHFTGPGLAAALGRAGFDAISLGEDTSTVGLPASVQYRRFGRCLFPSGTPLRVASGLCVLVRPLARAVDRRGGGDVLYGVARRPSPTS